MLSAKKKKCKFFFFFCYLKILSKPVWMFESLQVMSRNIFIFFYQYLYFLSIKTTQISFFGQKPFTICKTIFHDKNSVANGYLQFASAGKKGKKWTKNRRSLLFSWWKNLPSELISSCWIPPVLRKIYVHIKRKRKKWD